MTIRVGAHNEVLGYNDSAFELLQSSLPASQKVKSHDPNTVTHLFEQLRNRQVLSNKDPTKSQISVSILERLAACSQEKVTF